MSTSTIPRLKEQYFGGVREQLKADLALGNIMQVPRFEKVVIDQCLNKLFAVLIGLMN